MPRARANGNGKRLATPQSVDAAVKSICDIMRRSNCAGALQYVPELTWILFFRILDERETREEERASFVDHDLDLIEAKGREVADAIAELRKKL